MVKVLRNLSEISPDSLQYVVSKMKDSPHLVSIAVDDFLEFLPKKVLTACMFIK